MKNNTLRTALCGALITMAGYSANAQNKELKVGTNPTIKEPSAVFEVESANKGMLLPRVALTSLTDVTTIANPADALTVFNTAFNGVAPNNVIPGYYYWSATDNKWIRLLDKEPVQDLRFVGRNNHVTQDAGVNENGTSLGSGQDNIAIGRSAMRFIAAGSRNIAIGSSLGDLENGNDNIVIGNNSGGYLQNESNNIIIGNSMASLSGTDGGGNAITLSNSLRIGNFLYGLYDSNTGKARTLVGDYFYSSPTDNVFKETFNIGSGGLWIKDINSSAYTSSDAADKIIVADADGVLKTTDVTGLAIEPWNQATTATTKATSNTQNIYQDGKVGIGNFATANPIADLDIRGNGTLRVGLPHADELNGSSPVGNYSIATGVHNKVPSDVSSSFGQENIITGDVSMAWGQYNKSTGFLTTTYGWSNENEGLLGTMFGFGNKASATSQLVFGRFNAITAAFPSTSVEPNDPILQVGNGTQSDRSNALTLLRNGKAVFGVSAAGNLAMPTELLDLGGSANIGSGGLRIRNINSAAYTSTNAADKIVVADANGVLKTATAAAPQFFYTPSLVLPTTSTDLPSYVTFAGGTFTVDLHAVYANQFGMTGNVAGPTRSAIKSASATTLPALGAAALEYFVTYFDNTVFDPNSITLSDAGILTYQVLGSAAVTEKTYMNIVFKIK
ncbi:hypothetical protein [Pedobacter sp. SL55]|uniref:hypothetical protein n=1 Tax=Pedobacter sp. SL55 TaxID=2995161 RepID=UPI00226E3F7B|nr:hypothetical protein [Pedobacter sp. SL55]WAC42516.1 hypothetical protein OVA16_09240 [Pedobacter sp. SL55]